MKRGILKVMVEDSTPTRYSIYHSKLLILIINYILLFSFSKVPRVLRALAPKGSLEVHEEAINAFPYIKTVITVRSLIFIVIN